MILYPFFVGLLQYMRHHDILVEICLTSNEAILGVWGDAHPFFMYRQAGVPVSINTDDEGVSRSNLTMVFVKAVQRYDLSYDEVKDLARNSLEYSFLDGRSLFENNDYTQPAPGFKLICDPNWQSSEEATPLMRDNPKLKRQVRLECAFVAFAELLRGLSRDLHKLAQR